MTCKYLEEEVPGIFYCGKKAERGLGQYSLGCAECKDRVEK